MKTALALLVCFFALALFAAEPTRPASFEVRLVVDSESPHSEQLACVQPRNDGGKANVEQLHVRKKALLDRSALKSAALQKNSVTGTHEILVTFTERGTKRFAEVTRAHVGQRLAIVIDGKVYSAPRIMMEISGGKAVIAGSFSEQEAAQFAARLSELAPE